jgi:hypothetical protein
MMTMILYKLFDIQSKKESSLNAGEGHLFLKYQHPYQPVLGWYQIRVIGGGGHCDIEDFVRK